MWALHRAARRRRDPGAAGRRADRLPDAAADAGRSGGGHRRRLRHDRGHRADPREPRPRQADADRSSFIWIGNMLTGDFGDSFFYKRPVARLIARPHRADPRARPSPRSPWPPCSRCRWAPLAAVSPGIVDRPRRDGVLGAELLGAGVRHRLLPDLAAVGQARLVPGAGLPVASPSGFGGFIHRLILPTSSLAHDLHRADRAHDAHQRARGAQRGLRPHGAREGPAGTEGRVWVTRCAMRRCRSSPSSASGIALLIGGVVVTESVFNIPGLGRLTVDAVLARDYPDGAGGDPAVLGRLRAGQPA